MLFVTTTDDNKGYFFIFKNLFGETELMPIKFLNFIVLVTNNIIFIDIKLFLLILCPYKDNIFYLRP